MFKETNIALSCSACWSCANAVRGREEVTAGISLRVTAGRSGVRRLPAYRGCLRRRRRALRLFLRTDGGVCGERGTGTAIFTAAVFGHVCGTICRKRFDGCRCCGLFRCGGRSAVASGQDDHLCHACRKGDVRAAEFRSLPGRSAAVRVVMPEACTRTASYAGLLDSLAECAAVHLAGCNVYELAAGLARGEFRLLRYASRGSGRGRGVRPGIGDRRRICGTGETLASSFRPKNLALCYDFVRWFQADAAGRRSMPRCAMSTPGRGDGRCFGGAEGDRRVPNGGLGMGRYDTGGRVMREGVESAPAVGYRLQGVAFPA